MPEGVKSGSSFSMLGDLERLLEGLFLFERDLERDKKVFRDRFMK